MAEVDILGDRPAAYWGALEKAALLAEVDAEGGKVRLVARPHGVPESLLYNSRSIPWVPLFCGLAFSKARKSS